MDKLIIASLLALSVNVFAESNAVCDPSFTDGYIQEVLESGEGYPTQGKYTFGESMGFGFWIEGKAKKGFTVDEESGEEWIYTVKLLFSKRPPLGTAYRFIYRGEGADCNDGYAKLEVKNIGGFAGGLTTESMNCFCSVD